jgi:hypothetical protein
MNIAVEFDVDIKLVKHAVRCFMRDWLARNFIWPLAFAIILAALIFWRADGLLIGLVAGFVVANYVRPLLLWPARLRLAMREASESGLHQRWTFDDDGVTFDTPLAMARMRWPMFKRMIRGRGVWLLIRSERAYYALPTEGFDGDTLDLIAAKISSARPSKR